MNGRVIDGANPVNTTTKGNATWKTKEPACDVAYIPTIRVVECDFLEIKHDMWQDGFGVYVLIDGKECLDNKPLLHQKVDLIMTVDEEELKQHRSTRMLVVHKKHQQPTVFETVEIRPKRLKVSCACLFIEQEDCWNSFRAKILFDGQEHNTRGLKLHFQEGELVIATVEHTLQPMVEPVVVAKEGQASGPMEADRIRRQ